MTQPALYLGLISGTSADGIDAALLAVEPAIGVQAAASFPYPEDLRARIIALARADVRLSLDELGTLDAAIGLAFADAATTLLTESGVDPARVRAIGSHGQTVRHRPDIEPPFTLQLGNPALIAERTGIDVVADFRRADMAAGGQGAPLAPAFHAAAFADSDTTRAVLNLGGIANVTVLAPGAPVRGFDTGPANCLLDGWAQRHLGADRDDGGGWAASGRIDEGLLASCLADPYFSLPPPKSTGREYFHLDWLGQHLQGDVAPVDVQATLVAVTAGSVADALRGCGVAMEQVLVCGGGVHNPVLMAALAAALAPAKVVSSASQGLDPDFIEAAAFAWLAERHLADLPGNLPEVTGARGSRVLGARYPAPRWNP